MVFIADFEKAFDKLRLDFIYKCLDFFNFCNSLVKWVKNYVFTTNAGLPEADAVQVFVHMRIHTLSFK